MSRVPAPTDTFMTVYLLLREASSHIPPTRSHLLSPGHPGPWTPFYSLSGKFTARCLAAKAEIS